MVLAARLDHLGPTGGREPVVQPERNGLAVAEEAGMTRVA